jgi:multimeric flavodoxin WrbA
VSTPVYSRNVCAQLMAVFDRYCAVDPERPLEGKVGGAIAVGAGGGGGQSIAICTIYNWMRSCGAIGVPGELNGVTAVALDEGEVLKQDKRLRQARVLGENVLRCATWLRGEQHVRRAADKARVGRRQREAEDSEVRMRPGPKEGDIQ